MRATRAVLLLFGFGVVLAGVVGVAAADLDAGVPAASGETANVTIDVAGQEPNGTVEVLVALDGSETATDVPALQAHASASQDPLVTFAGATAGVTVERQFWLTSAVLVTVDTGQVPLDALAAIEGVQAIHENARVTVREGSADGVDSGAAASDASGWTVGAGTGEPALAAAPSTGVSAAPSTGVSAAPSTGVSTDSYDTTYGLAQINATEVWDEYSTQGEGTSVAVLDTGVDPDHPDIDVAKWAHFDGNGDPVDSEPGDGDGHGTHVSGTVTGGNASGTHIGVAPGADLYAVKVIDDDGNGTLAQAIAGIEWAVEEDADVISMSLGAPGYFEGFIDPIRNAQDVGTTVVASAGNGGENTSSSPGNVYDAISVGASTQFADIASFSSGEQIDTLATWGLDAPPDWPSEYIVPSVAAPGVQVESAEPGGGYGDRSGTSMAAPHVSGAVALMESVVADSVTPDEFEAALEETAWKPGDWNGPDDERDTRYGSGIVDVPAAIGSLPLGPNLVLASIDHPGEVDPDESLSVAYTVENVGDQDGTESSVALQVEGTGASEDDADTNVTVPAGETANGTLTLDSVSDQFEDGDTIAFTVALADFGDTASGTTDVEGDPAEFAVEILDASDPIEGENLTVTAGIENTGDLTATQTVTLDVPDVGDDAAAVTLDGGNSTTETLAVGTGAGDGGEYVATVASENDTATANVTVLAPAAFAVEILGVSEAVAGEDLTVTAGIENTGDIEDSQQVTLDVPGLGSDATNVTLDGGESVEETLAVATGAGDAGEYTATLTSAEDSASTNVTVYDEGAFTVSILGASEPVEGENLTVTAEVENIGDQADDQTVTLDVPGLGSDATNLTLGGGESVEETLSVATGAGDAGEYTATVTTGDDADSTGVTVLAPAAFAVAVVETGEPIEGEPLTVTVGVENTGDAGGSLQVTLDVPGLGSDAANVTLGGGESAEETLAVPTGVGDAGEYTATVASETQSATATVTVALPSLPGVDQTPTDPDGDRLYEDADGDGAFSIFDVQTFFTSFGSPPVQDHAWAYNFDEGDDEINIFDVQSLFELLQ